MSEVSWKASSHQPDSQEAVDRKDNKYWCRNEQVDQKKVAIKPGN